MCDVTQAVFDRYEGAVEQRGQLEAELNAANRALADMTSRAEQAERAQEDYRKQRDQAQVDLIVARGDAKAACERAANCKARIKGLTADQCAAFATILAHVEERKGNHDNGVLSFTLGTLRRLVGKPVAP
jgi:chromosome segregation ATPase